jgi:2'-5' RNA ligase
LTQTRDGSPGTVEGRDRLRLFCALRLPEETIEPLVAWQARELRGGRIVPPENLHLTLAFLGSRPADDLEPVVGALREAADGARQPVFTVWGYRETRSVGMLVCDDHKGHGAAFADDLFAHLERLGVYRREARPWLPHLTVIRFRERPRLRPSLPDLGRFSPSDAAVYLSRLRPSGAEYDVVESVALGG